MSTGARPTGGQTASSVWMLARNDIPAAMAFIATHPPSSDDMAVILQLQDDPTELLARLAVEHGRSADVATPATNKALPFAFVLNDENEDWLRTLRKRYEKEASERSGNSHARRLVEHRAATASGGATRPHSARRAQGVPFASPLADDDIETLRRRLRIPPETASAFGEEAVRIVESHGYTSRHGKWVDLQNLIDAAVRGTVEYGPGDPVAPPPPRAAGESTRPRITVRNMTTLAAARELLAEGHAPAVLNFASPTHPGGGFLSGSRAQEEYLARSSALYACLRGRRMYAYSAGRRDPFLADFVIVSPNVPVFRDDDGFLLEAPWCCTILTSPAVHAYGVRKYTPAREREIEGVMRDRIDQLLRVAAAHEQRALVLGGWGCGAFGNDPAMIARLFHDALDGEIGRSFDAVMFAVSDWSPERRFVGAFERVFGDSGG